MNVRGLQKLTLLDFPGKVACTIFTGGCNFRCPYCHNGSLVRGASAAPPAIPLDDLLAFLRKRRGVLDGVCISGGEPTLQPELASFCAALKEMGYLVKLDTNGTSPAVLRALADAHLIDFVAMDIKNSPARYAETVGAGAAFSLAPVQESVAFLLEGGLPYEFRTTAVRPLHSPADFAAIGQWLAGAQAFFLQAFVDSGDLLSDAPLAPLSPAQMRDALAALRVFIPAARIRGE